MLPSTHTSGCVAAVIVFATAGTIAQSPPAPSSPMTPGAVALLANAGDSAAVERARAALSHADPTVRAIAARVLGIGRVPGAVRNLRSAFEWEIDTAAAAELARALLYFNEPDTVAAVETRLPAAPWSAVDSYLAWLITARPDNSAERLERLFKSRPAADFSHASELIARAVTRLPKERDRALRGLLGTAASSVWRAALDRLGADVTEAEAAVMRQALAAENEAVREATVWALVSRLSKSEATPAGVLDAALPPGSPNANDAAASAGWEQFGRELVARRHRQARTPDRSSVIRSEGLSRQSDARLLLRLKEILAAEREAVTEVLGEAGVSNAPLAVGPALESTPPRGQLAMRTAAIPWPALLPDLLEVTGCPVTDSVRVGMFEISYRSDGRPQAVDMMPTELPPECVPALAALARLTIADPLHPILEGEKQYVVLLVSSEGLACLRADRPIPRAIEGERVVPGRIKQPTKIRDVRPLYPEAAQNSRVQGTVIVDALISSSGCVRSLNVLRSVHPVLDLEAVRAVSQWHFTPTLLEGVPVPVIMTVTVNFRLE